MAIVGHCDVRIWGLTTSTRLQRAFARAGVTRTVGDGGKAPGTAPLIMVRADYVIDECLVKALAATPGVLLVVAGRRPGDWIGVAAHAAPGQAPAALALIEAGALSREEAAKAGLRVLEPAELGSTFNPSLRKRAVPYVLSLHDTPVAQIEKRTFAAVYKGATDVVTKYVWPLPARYVTKWAAERHITPNTITTLSLILVFVATGLFAEGAFLTGAAAAWLMTFLDTVDGKLARVTLTSSKWGNVYDHGIDLIHPPFWWAAWYYGLDRLPAGEIVPGLDLALWTVLVGYVLGRLMEGTFIRCFGIQTHIWRPVDYAFRAITARRNPNLAILTAAAAFGRPDIGLVAMALWTALSLAFHATRIAQAAIVRARGGEIRSWLAESV